MSVLIAWCICGLTLPASGICRIVFDGEENPAGIGTVFQQIVTWTLVVLYMAAFGVIILIKSGMDKEGKCFYCEKTEGPTDD